MSKPDTTSGLLAKVLKFVRNPATSWSELDNKEPDPDEALSKQLLKEMIERKRRNDFVRKREFDMLRKMRQRDAMVGQDSFVRPSFSQSSMTSQLDERTNTLKKINEIEAQMSMQWSKTKPGSSNTDSINSSAYPLSANPAITQQPLGSPPAPSPLGQALPVDCAATEPVSLQERAELEVKKASAARPASDDMLAFTVASDFSPTRIAAMDVSAVTHDAELEEASIRFANGDDAGAEAGLIEMLSPKGSRAGHSETWMTFFDLYRATGQQDKFETTATRFVELFNRSAPQWFSIPDMVRQMDGMNSQMGSNLFSFELSGQIQGDAIALLDQPEAKLMGADSMHISCAKLIRVDFSAAGMLLNWVSARQAEGCSVRFSDVNRLVAAFFNVMGITEHARVVTRVD